MEPRPHSLRPLPLAAAGCLIALASLGCSGETTSHWREAAPHPGLGPHQVVAAQLEAFRNNDAHDAGIEVAFRFSSPGNRSHTGPIERFASMVHDGPYELLLGFDGVSMRPVETRRSDARQTVTVVRDGEARIYHFLLSKQRRGACVGCWMTDAVLVEDEIGEAI